jgi:hypothetical protein
MNCLGDLLQKERILEATAAHSTSTARSAAAGGLARLAGLLLQKPETKGALSLAAVFN